MTISISYMLSNLVNFESVNDGRGNNTDEFTSIYGNKEFEFDVNFQIQSTEEETVNISDVELYSTSADFIIASPSSSTSYSIKKDNEINLFNEEFTIVTFADEFLRSPSENIVTDYNDINGSIVRWQPPDVRILDELYSFIISYEVNGQPNQDIINISQFFYWNFDNSVHIFNNFLLDSEL